MTPHNPDRVSPPVLTRSTILGLLGLLAAVGVDLNTDDAGKLADAAVVVLPLVGSLAGAVWGTFRARQHVTPILPGDTPRDLDGDRLVKAGRSETAGYPPPESYQPTRRPPFETP